MNLIFANGKNALENAKRLFQSVHQKIKFKTFFILLYFEKFCNV